MTSWLDSIWMTKIGWVLLHSAWQFSIVMLCIVFVERVAQLSVRGRYSLYCIGLLVIFVFGKSIRQQYIGVNQYGHNTPCRTRT